MQAASSLPIAGATNDIVRGPAVVRQLRANVLVVAALLLLYLAMEFQARPGLVQHLIELDTICLGLLGIAFLLTFSELFARHWRAVTFIFCSLLVSVGTAISVIVRMPDAYLAGLVLFSMGCAVFVPWEAKWQAVFNLTCIVAFVIEEAIVFPAEQYKIERLFALAVLMLAQLAARLVGGYRESLYSQVESVRKAEASLRAVLNSAPDAMMVVDKDGTIIMANPQTGKLFGYDAAELLGSSVETLIPGRFRGFHSLHRADYLANPHHMRRMAGAAELHALRRDGGEFPVEINLSPAEGHAEGAVICAIRDITARKRAERKLRVSEEKFKRIFEASLDAIAINSLADAKYLDVNDGYLKLLGYTREEVLGRTPDELKIWANHAERAQAFKELRTKGFIQNFEGEFLTKDGTRRSGLFSGVVVDLPEQACVISFVRDITERKRAEQTRSLLAAIVQSADEAIFSTDQELKITSWNPGAERVYGYPAAEIIGRSVEALVPSDHQDEPKRVHASMLREGVQRYETRRLRKDGTLFDACVTVSPIYDEAGAFVGASAIVSDITERKRAEEMRALLASIVQSTDDAIISADLDWKITSWNAGAQKLYRYPAAEVMGRTLDRLVPPDRLEEAGRLRARLQRGESVQQFETTRTKKDGTLFDASITVSPVYDADGAVTGVSAITKDITERKQAEQTRLLLASIVRSADDAIYSVDTDRKITSWNPGAERLYGYSAAEILGRIVDVLVPPDRLGEIARAVFAILAGENIQRYETQRLRKDGTLVDVTMTVSPILDAAGGQVGASVVAHDITERKLAERAGELARSNAELEEFAHVVSHDLREPLHNVASYVQLLAKDYQGKLGADADEYIRYVLDGAAWMQTLIDDLRAYSRATAQPKAIEPVDFGSVVSQAIANLSTAIDEHRATVTYEPMPTVAAAAGAMTQVFQNLIENALKFRGQEPPTVHVGVKRGAGDWVFSVRDNGIGIDPEHSRKIFMIFHRLHNRREYPGSGIGLAVCKKIVERHGGRIWVESEPGRGATFYFTIPA